MKRCFLVAAAIIVLAGQQAVALDQKVMSVTVLKTQLRSTPGYLGSILVVLAYGDRITVLAQPAGSPKDWLFVQAPNGKLRGWVNLTALTDKKVVLKSDGQKAEQAASSGDVALAGKGFNADVEAEYASEEGLDYTWVDRMAAFQVSPDLLASFIDEGGLDVEGGRP